MEAEQLVRLSKKTPMKLYKHDFIATFITVAVGTALSVLLGVDWTTIIVTAITVAVATLLFRAFNNDAKREKSTSVRRNSVR